MELRRASHAIGASTFIRAANSVINAFSTLAARPEQTDPSLVQPAPSLRMLARLEPRLKHRALDVPAVSRRNGTVAHRGSPYGSVRERGIVLPVVVLTAHGDVATTRTALKNGAIDFLEKPVDDEVLIDVLKNAIRIDSERHRARMQQVETMTRIGRLTPRERDVLNLLADGLQHREIAERLGISPRTVEVYKARMMEKLQCRTLAEVVRLGSELSTQDRSRN